MDADEADQRLPHQQNPPKPASLDAVSSLVVLYWSGITGEADPTLAKIREERGYSYSDVVNVSPDKLPNYEGSLTLDEIKIFKFYMF